MKARVPEALQVGHLPRPKEHLAPAQPVLLLALQGVGQGGVVNRPAQWDDSLVQYKPSLIWTPEMWTPLFSSIHIY